MVELMLLSLLSLAIVMYLQARLAAREIRRNRERAAAEFVSRVPGRS